LNITADTNVLVRVIVGDDQHQSDLAKKALQEADLVAISTPCLCELVWVLSKSYRIVASDISTALRHVVGNSNISVNKTAVEAGLAMLDQGGDFADGVIAFEGLWLGGEEFVSFDNQAVKLLKSKGIAARLPTA
jgi:predicted nucleic-acid-binding protein